MYVCMYVCMHVCVYECMYVHKPAIDEAITKYYDPKAPYSFLLAKEKIKGIIASIKKDFLKEGIPFGSLNEFNQWGIPTSKPEFEFMGTSRYMQWKGIARNSIIIANAGRRTGLITTTENCSIEVPQFIKISKLKEGNKEDGN